MTSWISRSAASAQRASRRPANIGLGKAFMGGLAVIALGAGAIPASAQDSADARLRKLEAEVRALQRKVFPGGTGRFFEPEVSTANTATPNTAAPSTTAVTDILARLDAIEAQLQRVTAQVEENSNTLRGLNTRVTALENGQGTGTAMSATPAPTPAPSTAATTPAPTPAPAPAAASPSAERLAAVQQIAKPQTDDPGDDEYSYGYRLWNAGFYPEAEQQLRLFVEKYPDHWRTTYGRNLLGRAYMDDGKPRDAAPWFLKNYQADKAGARAPDSLLYLAEAMIAVNDTNRACIALSEFAETYPAVAAGRLSGEYEANRKKVSCN